MVQDTIPPSCELKSTDMPLTTRDKQPQQTQSTKPRINLNVREFLGSEPVASAARSRPLTQGPAHRERARRQRRPAQSAEEAVRTMHAEEKMLCSSSRGGWRTPTVEEEKYRAIVCDPCSDALRNVSRALALRRASGDIHSPHGNVCCTECGAAAKEIPESSQMVSMALDERAADFRNG